MELAVIGRPAFTLGFQLAGIKHIHEVESKVMGVVEEIIRSKEAGIVIMDKESFESLDEYQQQQLEDSINPVFVVISEEASDQNLRRMIKKSIGVDVWEK